MRRIPVPQRNVFKSINSFAPCCESYVYVFLIGAAISNRFKKISLEEIHV